MGAWIEITMFEPILSIFDGRTPRWVRGLKLSLHVMDIIHGLSHPTMGAWIEILVSSSKKQPMYCRTPRWVRGLKSYTDVFYVVCATGRTPRWVRGLKSEIDYSGITVNAVAPHDGCVD